MGFIRVKFLRALFLFPLKPHVYSSVLFAIIDSHSVKCYDDLKELPAKCQLNAIYIWQYVSCRWLHSVALTRHCPTFGQLWLNVIVIHRHSIEKRIRWSHLFLTCLGSKMMLSIFRADDRNIKCQCSQKKKNLVRIITLPFVYVAAIKIEFTVIW